MGSAPPRTACCDLDAAIAAIEEFETDALTAQIAGRAGVPRTHVYRHFDGKRALDLAVSRHAAGQIGESIRARAAATGSARAVIGGAIAEHLSWVEAHPNLYRFMAQHAYAVAGTGSAAADDAKAAFAHEMTDLITRYLQFDIEKTPAERLVIDVVGMIDSTAAWRLEHPEVPRADLTAQLTEQVWLVIDHTTRGLGLALDPDAELPAR